jgi:hypothetical protein
VAIVLISAFAAATPANGARSVRDAARATPAEAASAEAAEAAIAQTTEADTRDGVILESGPVGATSDTTPEFEFSTPGREANLECAIRATPVPQLKSRTQLKRQMTGIVPRKPGDLPSPFIDTPTPRADYGKCADPGSHQAGEELAPGEYTFLVRDAAGQGSESRASREFAVAESPTDAVVEPGENEFEAPTTTTGTAARSTLASNAETARSKPFGYVDNWGINYGPAYYHDRMYLAAAGGSNHVRIGITGCQLPGESAPRPADDASWTKAYNEINQAYMHGQTVVLNVKWSPDCSRISPPPVTADVTEFNKWKTFVTTATAYANIWSQRVAKIEIWNEPNLRTFWCGIKPKHDDGSSAEACLPFPDPWYYAQTYYYGWQGVRDLEVAWAYEATVMTGGLGVPRKECVPSGGTSPYSYSWDYYASYNYICIDDFLRGVRYFLNQWNAAGRVEMVGSHIYPKPSATDQDVDGSAYTRGESEGDAVRQFERLVPIFDQKALFITEAGVRSDGPLSNYQQCVRLLDIYNALLHRPTAAGMLVYRVLDTPEPEESNDKYYYMGTVAQNGAPKDAWWYLRAMRLPGYSYSDCA